MWAAYAHRHTHSEEAEGGYEIQIQSERVGGTNHDIIV